MESNYGAVINGDLVKSSEMSMNEKDSLLAKIKNITEEYLHIEKDRVVEIYRGDSFQIIIKEPWRSLSLSILLRAYCKFKGQDVRISVAVSNIDRWPAEGKQAEGNALVLSGVGLDTISVNKENYLFQIDVPNGKEFGSEFQIHSLVLDDIMNHWTPYQAYVVSGLIQKKQQNTIATELEIKQQSVSRIKKSSKWNVVKAIIERYTYITNYYIHQLEEQA